MHIPTHRFRGIMAVLNTSAANMGWLVGLILGWFTHGVPNGEIILILAYALPSPIFLIISAFLPESPLWLTKHGQDHLAEKALMKVRGPQYPIQVIR